MRRGIVIGIGLLLLVGAIATRQGWIVAAPPRPAGMGAWMVSRATGLVAYLALALDVVVGLLVSTRAGDRIAPRGVLVALHGWLSPLALVLVLAHAGVLLADRYVRFDVIDLVVPFAASGAIAIGVLAAYLAVAVHASFGLRKRIGTVMWRRLHYLSFGAFVLASAHALVAGSDRGHPWFAAIYAAALLTVTLLTASRIWRARRVVTR